MVNEAYLRLLGQRPSTGRAADTSSPGEARPLAVRAADLAGQASTVDPADARLRFELAYAQAALGDVEARAGDAAAARSWYQRARDLMTALRDDGRLAGGTLNGDEPEALADVERKLAAAS